MAANPDVSVIVPTFNRKAWLTECLNALCRQTYPRGAYEIIVVDDGSSDGTEDAVRRFKDVVYLHQENKGQAGARNLGLSAARASIIAFTDDDCIPSKDWIEQGLAAMRETKLDGIEGQTTTDKEKISPLSVITYTYHGGGFMTCNCFYKRQAIDAAGGFGTVRNMRFREDTDIAWRIMDKGYRLGFDPRPKVFHRVVKLTPWQYVRKHIRIQEPWWNAYLSKHHPRRYKESSEMLLGILSTQTMYHYIFWAALIVSILSSVYLPRSAGLLSLVLLVENYLIVVFLHTRMRSGIEVSHLLRYPKEFLGLAAVWWIAIISDTFWKIAGNIRFRTINL